jgi:3-mercaptopyruvate sulfurtransferase SseA
MGAASEGIVHSALVMLGDADVKLYDGSFFEWAADPNLPIEIGY